jgi:Rho-binding antiterminator
MKTYQPLNCDLHDFLEIACMREYKLDVELIDGQRLIARALTTRTSETKEEFMVFELDGNRHEIRLDQLAAITPLDDNADFGRIALTEASCRF